MVASTTPSATSTHRCRRSSRRTIRQGRRHAANTNAAVTIRSQATPSTLTRVNSSTASDGPR
jgi:hypothetical protein